MMRYLILILLVCLIVGCGGNAIARPPADPVTVKVPVPVPCLGEVPAMPMLHSEAELLAMDDYQFITAIHADRLALQDHARKLDAILQACAMSDPSPD